MNKSGNLEASFVRPRANAATLQLVSASIPKIPTNQRIDPHSQTVSFQGTVRRCIMLLRPEKTVEYESPTFPKNENFFMEYMIS